MSLGRVSERGDAVREYISLLRSVIDTARRSLLDNRLDFMLSVSGDDVRLTDGDESGLVV